MHPKISSRAEPNTVQRAVDNAHDVLINLIIGLSPPCTTGENPPV